MAYARFTARKAGDDGDDLLQGAYERWLKSDGPIEGPEATYHFLCGAIRSIASNILRRTKLVRQKDGVRTFADDEGPDPIEGAPDETATADESLFFQQLYDLCDGDEDMQLLLMASADAAQRSDIQKELGWDDRKYEAVTKRKRRLVARWKIEGKLG